MTDEDDDLFAVRPAAVATVAAPAPDKPARRPAKPKPKPDVQWKRNPGHLPEDAVGKRVRVKLRDGSIGSEDGGSMVPPGWAADGKGGCNWRKAGHAFDIEYYVVL